MISLAYRFVQKISKIIDNDISLIGKVPVIIFSIIILVIIVIEIVTAVTRYLK